MALHGAAFDALKLQNLLPALFLWIVTAVIWSSYILLHLLPMFGHHTPEECFSATGPFRDMVGCRAVWQAFISQSLTMMYMICYVRSILVAPGTVSDPKWRMGTASPPPVEAFEFKGSGRRRFCKWCYVYKPDRCHHCRLCGTCVLKMDHHCPWIMNCVGFKNHKYFFLLVIYAWLSTVFVATTSMESLIRSQHEEMNLSDRFMLVECVVLSVIMGTLLTAFFTFHAWLMLRGMTTIEFCERRTRFGGDSRAPASYDQGLVRNLYAVLGPNVWTWFLPTAPPEGDGTSFTLSTSFVAEGTASERSSMLEKGADPEWTAGRSEPGSV
eukprot:TRINITY_DN63932_c0_g1_i1.p1 TRINITY_DN63932_c0_g1~~TRINITY_DN63932_c0_g1_i1.p1  ORF type:complete len:326 (-),score=48.51 TRINITY_DN63932_c0_g1_i1:16-993(-)